MNPIMELSVWIETERQNWQKRGVDVLEHEGRTIFAVTGTDGNAAETAWVFVGSVEACNRQSLTASEFVKLIVLGDMSVEHSKILIENAVEQVAGR